MVPRIVTGIDVGVVLYALLSNEVGDGVGEVVSATVINVGGKVAPFSLASDEVEVLLLLLNEDLDPDLLLLLNLLLLLLFPDFDFDLLPFTYLWTVASPSCTSVVR